MRVEFVCPPNSSEVIMSANMVSIPVRADKVNIEDKWYRVYSVEWHQRKEYPIDDNVDAIINLIEDEIENAK